MMFTGKTIFRQYKIIKEIGGGAFGNTYLAIDTAFPGEPSRVVKHLCPYNEDSQALKIAQRLFKTEAEVLSRLGEHDRIPRLFSYFEEDGEFFLVQELIEGKNLVSEFRSGQRWSEDRVIEFLQELLEILSVVHQQNAVHRDLKPANIMRGDRDLQLVLIDFGAVKELLNVDERGHIKSDRSVIIGTPGYMAPEQFNGQPGKYSDVYSVGKLAIQALTGLTSDKLPSSPRDFKSFLEESKINISSDLESFLCKAIATEPRERYADAAEALQVLPIENSQIAEPTLISYTPQAVISPQNLEPTHIIKKSKFREKLLTGMLGAIAMTIGAGFIAVNLNDKPDYTQLETYLENQEWQQADTETQRLLLKIADETSALDAEAIAEFPCESLAKIDELWTTNSDGRFGFTPQTEAFLNAGNEFDNYTPSTYEAFTKQVQWMRMGVSSYYGDLIFQSIAPSGHLPSPGRMAANKNDLRIREREMLLARFNTCGF